MRVTRRTFTSAITTAGLGVLLERWPSAQAVRPVEGGRLVRTMPMGRLDGRPTPPLHTLLGAGLDARQFTDLSHLDAETLRTSTPQFYIRTARPPRLPEARRWRIACGGLVGDDVSLELAALAREARDQGLRLMECAGNADPANFGLLSAAEWSGVPMAAVLDQVRAQPGASRIRVTGIDDEETPSATSNAGASWVFTRDELERSGAFLAVGMNGAPLTSDHGAPVRLVVPNYYGCSCIKWVSRIDWVGEAEPATLQMMEFSLRTHQRGVPRLARDYEPPAIDLAATPIRVEQWETQRSGATRIVYRVVGLRWGGSSGRAPLTIRFRATDPFAPVDDSPDTGNPQAWSLWSHRWTPDAPGRYAIALGLSDRSIRTRRLDLGYYTREVSIDRV